MALKSAGAFPWMSGISGAILEAQHALQAIETRRIGPLHFVLIAGRTTGAIPWARKSLLIDNVDVATINALRPRKSSDRGSIWQDIAWIDPWWQAGRIGNMHCLTVVHPYELDRAHGQRSV